MMTTTLARWLQAMSSFGVAVLVAACATQPPASKTELPFDQAVAQATDGLMVQTQKMQSLLTRMSGKSGVVLDPMIDAGSGQQTAATQLLQDRVTERLATQDSIQVVPFQRANLDKARYLLTGTMTRLQVDQPRGPMEINLALTELASGKVIAQSSAITRDEGLDHTPLLYYRDTPVPTKDRVVEGYVRTSTTAPGQKADAYYLERLAVAPLIKDATSAYNAERYQDALAGYNAAAGDTAVGEQLRVLNGIYLSSAKLGKSTEAEQAFGKLVAYGIANQQLGVKFLFNPNSTGFWSEQRISGPYPMWLREIAKASAGAKVCMDIIGHTSHTGSVAYNDTLSLQRAKFIQQRLVGEASVLGTRTASSGKGFRENIIGSGTDDSVDALDRRVEFKIVDCGVMQAAR